MCFLKKATPLCNIRCYQASVYVNLISLWG